MARHEASVATPELWVGWSLPRSFDAEGYLGRFVEVSASGHLSRAFWHDEDITGVSVHLVGGKEAAMLLCRVSLLDLAGAALPGPRHAGARARRARPLLRRRHRLLARVGRRDVHRRGQGRRLRRPVSHARSRPGRVGDAAAERRAPAPLSARSVDRDVSTLDAFPGELAAVTADDIKTDFARCNTAPVLSLVGDEPTLHAAVAVVWP